MSGELSFGRLVASCLSGWLVSSMLCRSLSSGPPDDRPCGGNCDHLYVTLVTYRQGGQNPNSCSKTMMMIAITLILLLLTTPTEAIMTVIVLIMMA